MATGLFLLKQDYRVSTPVTRNWDGYHSASMDHYKPILFPPDCLAKEIETEYGKEVPIDEISELVGIELTPTVSGAGILVIYGNIEEGPIVEKLPLTYEVLQYFYSRHIAFNLEPDDYISVESLKKNPYKL